MIEHHRNIHEFTKDFHKQGNIKIFICSDVHYDAKKCDRDLFKKHLNIAKKECDLIFINGDFFDLMQGRYDPRSGKYDIRPEYKHADYLDCVIDDGAKALSDVGIPILIGQGNHETNILKRLETNPIARLVREIKRNGGEAYMGGYSGWLILTDRRKDKGGKYSRLCSTKLWYHHGGGGNAKRSKGILRADIDQAQNPDADVIVCGHDHNKWHLPVTVKRINSAFKEYDSSVHHLQTGSYKMQTDRFAGWSVEKKFNTPRLGGWFLELNYYYTNGGHRNRFMNPIITEAY